MMAPASGALPLASAPVGSSMYGRRRSIHACAPYSSTRRATSTITLPITCIHIYNNSVQNIMLWVMIEPSFYWFGSLLRAEIINFLGFITLSSVCSPDVRVSSSERHWGVLRAVDPNSSTLHHILECFQTDLDAMLSHHQRLRCTSLR